MIIIIQLIIIYFCKYTFNYTFVYTDKYQSAKPIDQSQDLIRGHDAKTISAKATD